jgi:Fe-S cluster biogenesis protein NfuA
MSEAATQRRIRAQASASDARVMGFVLDAEVQPGRAARFDGPGDAPLSKALFGISGVARVEVSGATIWVQKTEEADWAGLKPAIAAAIRTVLDFTETPLGQGAEDRGSDTALLQRVEELLQTQVNPAIAAHGGHISAERVEAGTVYLRMSGGCQGCAASAATLRDGVERMLHAALPQIVDIVDVTDHAQGTNPFYTHDTGKSPVFNRPVPPGVIDREDGQISVDPAYLGPRLGLTPETLRAGMQRGDVVGVTESGEGADAGKTRIVIRSPTRAWAAEIAEDGSAREIPPPAPADEAAGQESALSERVRAYLAGLEGETTTVTYGALARALGMWQPGSVRRVTAALEATMRADAAAGRPFIAARAVGRGRDALPGKGFFDLARTLGRGPATDESDRDYHARECAALAGRVASASGD